jgi:membrane-anchored protein YejM (alkaline phosphatase superfamily)
LTAPNIFLLVVDSLRADAVCSDHIPIPNIASFAHRQPLRDLGYL